MMFTHVIIFHYPCTDGAFSALAASIYFMQHKIRHVKYVPYRQNCPIQPLNMHYLHAECIVYFLDVSGTISIISEICKRVKRVVIIDHHQSANDWISNWRKNRSFPKNLQTKFDLGRSGAMLAWEYFDINGLDVTKSIRDIKRVYRLFQYVQDQDLWLHVLPYSQEFTAGFRSLCIELDPNRNKCVWRDLLRLSVGECINNGIPLVKARRDTVFEECKNATLLYIRGYHCLGVVTNIRHISSYLGSELAKRSVSGIGLVFTKQKQNDTHWSVAARSIKSVDTLQMASLFGGGGHKNSSGFSIERSNVLWECVGVV
jgi:oligoribonuclease NrnB/cAMP/cGMP phosphodiesterase (DHH superfamily)